MGVVERRYGIAGRAAGEAALEHGAGRKATDAFVLSRIARAVVDALDADDRGAVGALEEIVDDLRQPHSANPEIYAPIAHALQVAEGALARLGGR